MPGTVEVVKTNVLRKRKCQCIINLMRRTHRSCITHDIHLAWNSGNRECECRIATFIFILILLIIYQHVIIMRTAPDNRRICLSIRDFDFCLGIHSRSAASSLKCHIYGIFSVS